jgi:hypothetical protein
MTRAAGLSLFTAAAIVGVCGATTMSKATEANGVWCQVFSNYNNTGQDVCMAEQFGPDAVTAKFQVSPPGANAPDGYVTQKMAPNQQIPVMSWAQSKAAPRCTMVSPASVPCN